MRILTYVDRDVDDGPAAGWLVSGTRRRRERPSSKSRITRRADCRSACRSPGDGVSSIGESNVGPGSYDWHKKTPASFDTRNMPLAPAIRDETSRISSSTC